MDLISERVGTEQAVQTHRGCLPSDLTVDVSLQTVSPVGQSIFAAEGALERHRGSGLAGYRVDGMPSGAASRLGMFAVEP
jgi:hypothetical protein